MINFTFTENVKEKDGIIFKEILVPSGTFIVTASNILNDLKNKGYNVYLKFNDKYLYSDEDSDIDHACRKINGLSYEEFKKKMDKVKAVINIEKYKKGDMKDRKENRNENIHYYI